MKNGGFKVSFDFGVDRAVGDDATCFAGGEAVVLCDFAGAACFFASAGGACFAGFVFADADGGGRGGGCVPYRGFDAVDADVDA